MSAQVQFFIVNLAIEQNETLRTLVMIYLHTVTDVKDPHGNAKFQDMLHILYLNTSQVIDIFRNKI